MAVDGVYDDDLRWPLLDEPYAGALRSAVAWILARYSVLGIIACGSIIRGNPGPNSDLDLVVVHGSPERQRVQRHFQGIPTEIFVNPPAAVRHYFVTENRDARPSTAHMIAHGLIVLDRDPVVAELVAEARQWWTMPPAVPAFLLAMTRYSAVDLLDNAVDLLTGDETGGGKDAANAELLLQRAIHEIVRYFFLHRTLNIPRDKELFRALARIDGAAGELLDAVYRADAIPTRLAHAQRLADHILGVHEFFAWETAPEVFVPD